MPISNIHIQYSHVFKFSVTSHIYKSIHNIKIYFNHTGTYFIFYILCIMVYHILTFHIIVSRCSTIHMRIIWSTYNGLPSFYDFNDECTIVRDTYLSSHYGHIFLVTSMKLYVHKNFVLIFYFESLLNL